jgi:hypothetical protein
MLLPLLVVSITMEDVVAHDSQRDCWMVLRNQVLFCMIHFFAIFTLKPLGRCWLNDSQSSTLTPLILKQVFDFTTFLPQHPKVGPGMSAY